MHPALVQQLYHARSSSKMCANFRSRNYIGIAVCGAFCRHVQVGGLSAPTQGLRYLVLLPLNYLIICTLLWCNHCTVLETAPKYAQTSIHGSVRHCSTRSILRAGTGRNVFCANSRFTYFGSLSPLLHFHVHPALVEPLHRARSSFKMCENFHSRTYTSLQ